MTYKKRHMTQSNPEMDYPFVTFEPLELPEGGHSNVCFWILADGERLGHANRVLDSWTAYFEHPSIDDTEYGKIPSHYLKALIIGRLNPYQNGGCNV